MTAPVTTTTAYTFVALHATNVLANFGKADFSGYYMQYWLDRAHANYKQ